MIGSTLTRKEFYKLNGYLPREDVEEMLDEEPVYQASIEAIKALKDSYPDICCGFVEEGSFDELLAKLRGILKTAKRTKIYPELSAFYDELEDFSLQLVEQGNNSKDILVNEIIRPAKVE